MDSVSKIQSITNDAEYEAALRRVAAIFSARKGSTEGEELEELAKLIEEYEDKHIIWPINEKDQ